MRVNTEVIRLCFEMGMGASEMEEILPESIREQSESWEIAFDIDLSDPEPGIVALGEAPHFPEKTRPHR